MADIKVNFISNKNETGAVELKNGVTIPSGQTISGSGGIVSAGVVTATTYHGNGTGLTGLTIATGSKTIAFKRILAFDEYRS